MKTSGGKTETTVAYEFKPGRVRRAWLCRPCIDPSYAAGKFHAPVVVPVEDVKGELCLICKKPIA